ncbi:flp pilus-assembly TadE/G-like family protein [Arthrobacter zhaoxinii]|uniref:Flp pilus-assembly TadE/G-like family protein n=1 Tax=Arthrobacter zhaoxinii TaxID=2964616 RepID=A0ABY5YQT4_9MICC|nr:Rv3654c family TadE-like protein [Arthrobacter zhaoxinii]UWX96674.1 flp pilus-assembly TadE/G-like family protein [Arthrobacter zhaoxinii]
MGFNPKDRTGVRSADECRPARVRDGRYGKAQDRNGREPNDRGAGTVAAIGICLILLGFSVVALLMVQASVAAVRAATAADLAALAGADTLRGLQLPAAGDPPGAASGDACGVAGEVAARNNAFLRACTVNPETDTLTVETEVDVPVLPVPATARARAGPPG